VVLEHLDVRIRPGTAAEFEAAMDRGLRTVIARAEGMRGWEFRKCVETADRYLVEILWDSVEAHLVTYRESPLSPEFRALVAPYFAQAPELQHFELLAEA
jgi:heme-degrading monooxygenase HmoA